MELITKDIEYIPFDNPYEIIQDIIRFRFEIKLLYVPGTKTFDLNKTNGYLPGITDIKLKVPILFYLCSYYSEKYTAFVKELLKSKAIDISRCFIYNGTETIDILNFCKSNYMKLLVDYGFQINTVLLRERFITGVITIDQCKCYIELNIFSKDFLKNIKYTEIIENYHKFKATVVDSMVTQKSKIIEEQFFYALAILLKYSSNLFKGSDMYSICIFNNYQLIKRILNYALKNPKCFDIDYKTFSLPETIMNYSGEIEQFDNVIKNKILQVIKQLSRNYKSK